MKWSTEKMKISDLVEFEKNPRNLTEKQYEDLKKSLERFDLAEIPAVNRDGKIIAGHQRLRILRDLGRGDEEIEVRIPDRKLSEKEVEEYNIRSNKNSGEWDWDALANGFDVSDLQEWGFDPEELSIGFPDEEVEEDEAPEVDEENEPDSKYGEVYELGRHRLMCGDATKQEDVEKLMDGAKADCVVTDPPYGVGMDYGVFEDKKENVVELIKKFMPIALEHSPIALTPGIPCMWDYPRPDWVGCWVHPAPSGGCPWGFVGNNPILFYGKDPYLKNGRGRRPDSIVMGTDRRGEN